MAFDFSKGKDVSKSGIEQGRIDSTIDEKGQLTQKNTLEEISDAFRKYFLEPASNISGMKNVGELISDAGWKMGRGLAQFDPIYREEISRSPEAFEQITGQSISTKDELKKVGGETMRAGASALPYSKGFSSAATATSTLARAAQYGLKGALIGGSLSFGDKLVEAQEINSDEIKDIIKDTGISFVISGTMGILIEKIAGILQNRATKLYGRTFKAGTKDLQSDIEKEAQTINTKMSKEGYCGTAQTIRDKAISNKEKY